MRYLVIGILLLLSSVAQAKVYEVYLSRSLFSYSDISSAVNVLKKADKGDVVNLNLVGMGGRSDLMHVMIRSIRGSRAKVVSVIRGPVASAHAYIAIAPKHRVVKQKSWMMFHTGSHIRQRLYMCGQDYYCREGVRRHFRSELGWDLNYLRRILNSREISRVADGGDVYIPNTRR